MTDKFTIRDILVYCIVGIAAIIAYFLHDQCGFQTLVSQTKDYSDLTVLILIPISYLFGHIIFGIDDLVFNYILFKPLRKVTIKDAGFFCKAYCYILFGYRNLGIRKDKDITDDSFNRTVAKLMDEGKFARPEYYQIISDFCKGLFLIILVSTFLIIYNVIFNEQIGCLESSSKLFLLHIFLLLIFWYRGRAFSAYYVNYIERKIKENNDCT